MLRSDLCDYSDASIVVKGTIIVEYYLIEIKNRPLAFKNNAPFIYFISCVNIKCRRFRYCNANVQFA